ncbi:MAG: DinB family protein [Acidobacteria bacterium]|nr:DinB family protein [Acidobacteriota bacterium]
MKFESIADIYAANQRSREKLLAVLSDIRDDEADKTTDDEPWSAAYIAEHIAIVSNGMAGICSKLIEKAKANGAAPSVGLAITDTFYGHLAKMATMKAEAPERVKPTGSFSIEESTAKLDAANTVFQGLREGFEQLDLSEPTFPHPYFGDLTATEWFALSGLHERRHTEQLIRLRESLRQ